MRKAFIFFLIVFACGITQAQNINGAEYFWNTDPGVGMANFIPISPSQDTVVQDLNISTAGLKEGPHRLGIRFRTEDGEWGVARYRQVVVHQYTGAEYFWNTDPGLGSGTFVPLSSTELDYDFNFNVSTTGLAQGTFHKLFVRAKGLNGNFGPAQEYVVHLVRSIISAEYFWDNDPGAGNGTPLPLLTTGNSADVCHQFSTTGMMAGDHYLYIRMKSADGVWSLPYKSVITITESSIPTGCVGDFDKNAVVNGIDLLLFLAEFANESCAFDLTGDQYVNVSDLLLFAGVFGSVCP